VAVDGLKMTQDGPGGGHFRGMAALWSGSRLNEGNEFQGDGFTTGWGSSKTIDQAVVDATDTGALPFSSLEFGVKCGQAHVRRRMIYRGDSQPLPPESDPAAMFDRLFADLTGDPEAIARLKAQRMSTIDLVGRELQALEGRYGADDAIKVERHLEGIRDIEKRLELEAGPCVAPEAPTGVDPDANADYPQVGALQMQMLVRALACDLTRVASIQWSFATSNVVHSWLGHSTSHHSHSHSDATDKADRTEEVDIWYAQQFAAFLDMMAAEPEPTGEGSLLDNSLVVWGRELATPNHGFDGVPFVLAGRAAGNLVPGRFLSFDGPSHHRLLVSIGHMMGLTDLDNFGNLGAANGPLPGLP
jgi:hypothetical protein